MKLIIMWTTILTFFGCGQAPNKNVSDDKRSNSDKAEQYVSITCPTGDITLTLNSDKTFDLTILYWDNITKQHTGNETLKGSWTKAEDKLTLNSNDNNKIRYKLTSTSMKIGNNEIKFVTFSFTSNDKDFFGSRYNLLEKEQTDNFLLKATKQE
jgi:hypothetical protein